MADKDESGLLSRLSAGAGRLAGGVTRLLSGRGEAAKDVAVAPDSSAHDGAVMSPDERQVFLSRLKNRFEERQAAREERQANLERKRDEARKWLHQRQAAKVAPADGAPAGPAPQEPDTDASPAAAQLDIRESATAAGGAPEPVLQSAGGAKTPPVGAGTLSIPEAPAGPGAPVSAPTAARLEVQLDLGLAPPDPVPALTSTPAPAAPAEPYRRPDLGLLVTSNEAETVVSPEEIEDKKRIIQEVLDSFAIDAQVTSAVSGPRVTLFEVDPAPGVKVESISNIGNNLAMELAAMSLRILAPVPGQRVVGIEVPNQTAATVHLRRLLEEPAWAGSGAMIPLPVGRNIRGANVVLDLARAPHLLIAGATGSGKSVCMNSMIMALLFRFTPEELQLILVDPKVVEFSIYGRLPHLIVPVINDVQKVVPALNWVILEMGRRYKLLAKVGSRNIESFNKRTPELIPTLDADGQPIPARLPLIVVIIDELADIMMQTKGEAANSLARIAQLSRAVGIHTIIATQRPSVNVITGTIKANFPTRIAFQVSSQIDSRTILDGKGAESLLGRGDMLYKAPGGARLERVQSPMVEDREIEEVVNSVAAQRAPVFNDEVLKPAVAEQPAGGGDAGGGGDGGSEEDDELVERATEVIVRDRRATVSYVQRRLRIGYNRAAAVMEILEQRGIVGPQIGTAPREILINDTLEDPENPDAATEDDEAPA